MDFIIQNFQEFLTYTGFANATAGNLIMILVGIVCIWLAIKKDFEPLLLVPIGLGIILGNIPFRTDAGLEIGLYEDNSVLNIFYQGVRQGWYPPLVFLGIGAMTDFSALISNPKLILIGAAAQFGIFGAYMIALALGFEPNQAAGIAIIGGADGPTAIFLSSKLSPNLMGAIAVCAYSYMALVPVIQPPLMRLLTTKNERVIKMKPARQVSQSEKILFPIIGLLLTTFIVPSGLPLLGMLFFGNLLKESGKTTRLAKTAGSSLNDVIVMLLGLTVGCSTQASEFLTPQHGKDLCPRSLGVHHRLSERNTVCQTDECVLAKGQEDQPTDRKCRGERRTYERPYLQQPGFGIRPTQLPAHACHGTQRGGCHRFGRSRRSFAGFPQLSSHFRVCHAFA